MVFTLSYTVQMENARGESVVVLSWLKREHSLYFLKENQHTYTLCVCVCVLRYYAVSVCFVGCKEDV